MFNPKSSSDRINYGENLLPPIGFHLERAVGTTYSLDLKALLSVCVALGLSEEIDGELVNNPLSTLNALTKVSDKLTIFCESGQIKVPSKINLLYPMMEKMVVPVKLHPKRGLYPAFHPKMWLLEYANSDGEKKYRLVILSRNLTFDHSWDIACLIDGNVSDQMNSKSMPLADFLQFLNSHVDQGFSNYKRQKKDLRYFIDTVPYISFDLDQGFTSYDILPLGIGKNTYDIKNDILFNRNFHELVIMSPFLSSNVIKEFNSESKSLTDTKRTLITRKTEIPKIKNGEASRFEVYTLKDTIIDGESSLSEDGCVPEYEEMLKQDIHAKAYLCRKNSDVDLYLGSMNATHSAINNNVEIMLHLSTRKHKLNGDSFLADIMGTSPNENPFEKVDPGICTESQGQSDTDCLEKKLKEICRLNMKAEAFCENDGMYSLLISTEFDCTSDFHVMIKPLCYKGDYKDMDRDIVFENIGIKELSVFYAISIEKDNASMERIIMIHTEGIPSERDANILKIIIDNRRSFIELISMILGDDYMQSFLENKKTIGEYGYESNAELFPSVYEKMLKASVSNHEKIKEIKNITKLINDESIIPKEFTEMYDVFCETLNIK